MFDRKAEELVDLIEEALRQRAQVGPAPESTLRDLRGNMPLRQLALKSGIPHPVLSRYESGERPLTREAARKLAPVLGVTAEELWQAENVSGLRRLALKGELDPQVLLDALREVAFAIPDEQISERLVSEMLAILGEALESYAEMQKVRQEAADAEGQLKAQAALKSSSGRIARDNLGRVKNKPHDPRRF